ncbi:YjbF family lipoprotein [Actibacterium lipolyticum]|uniref:YjbF family lipoprotein n=1 Tax=Actibacterium lipolyticum TaxID=1524263 RepID=A0A238KQ03_9RHOB|nr:YjbF family lipoprotein [Actibacterium lipolyticum]SMX44740.1 hypothetical protein COL8621_02621 [Actibacterium lipolyticum]
MKHLLSAALLGVMALAGCDSDGSQREMFESIFKRDEAKVDPALTAKVQRLGLAGQPIIVASIEAENRAGLLVREVQRGRESTYISEGGVSISFRSGVLVATRGMGGDLMGADVATLERYLRTGGAGAASRSHAYLDGDEQIQKHQFSCQVASRGSRQIAIDEKSYATKLIEEKCSGSGFAFENLYWLDRRGEILQSRQWMGPALGSLAFRKVLR